jgi:lauroyl/myristoyl acyltransferase
LVGGSMHSPAAWATNAKATATKNLLICMATTSEKFRESMLEAWKAVARFIVEPLESAASADKAEII